MLNMKMPFNYLGIKGHSGKCRLLTGLDSIIVMLNNLITYMLQIFGKKIQILCSVEKISLSLR